MDCKEQPLNNPKANTEEIGKSSDPEMDLPQVKPKNPSEMSPNVHKKDHDEKAGNLNDPEKDPLMRTQKIHLR